MRRRMSVCLIVSNHVHTTSRCNILNPHWTDTSQPPRSSGHRSWQLPARREEPVESGVVSLSVLAAVQTSSDPERAEQTESFQPWSERFNVASASAHALQERDNYTFFLRDVSLLVSSQHIWSVCVHSSVKRVQNASLVLMCAACRLG